jgi:DNA-binding Lrp family transcriptional regulator
MQDYSEIEMHLLNDFQHRFPLVHRPFRKIGEHLRISEDEVIDHLARLSAEGVVSRVGPVFSPNCIGASTLAALAVPEERLAALGEWISLLPEINHNYQREHDYNLWFVATAPDQSNLEAVLAHIEDHAACPMLKLPLQESFHIDLGFDLKGGGRRDCSSGTRTRVQLNGAQTAIVAALQCGIPLKPEPFADIGTRIRMKEDFVLEQLARWREQGVIKRFGVVVRHHELGYRENAMAVWDVPDEAASAIGRVAARQPGVTLCYRRARQLPDWPYNLYCMVHGMRRDIVESQVASLARKSGLADFPSQILFNGRRFKQSGARYITRESHGRH